MIVAAVALVALGVSTFAQPPAEEKLAIGDVELRIGMSKSDAIALLKPYMLSPDATDSVLVSSHDPSYEPMGQVIFKDDRVAYVQRVWGQFESKNSFVFGTRLYALLRQLQDKAHERITVFSPVSESPPEADYSLASIMFVAGRRILTVSFVGESKKIPMTNMVSIEEAVMSEAVLQKKLNQAPAYPNDPSVLSASKSDWRQGSPNTDLDSTKTAKAVAAMAPIDESQPLDLVTLAQIVRPSVVSITTFDAHGKQLKSGSGFFMSTDGQIVTNLHVIDGALAAVAHSNNGGNYRIAGILMVSVAQDLAVLKADVASVPSLTAVESEDIAAGTRIAIIGSPLNLEGSLSEGIISAARSAEKGDWLQMTAPVSPGSSGSPVVNRFGEVVGVATLASTGAAQLLNFAKPSKYVIELLSAVGPEAITQSFSDYIASQRPAIFRNPDFMAARKALDQGDAKTALKLLSKLKADFSSEAVLWLNIGLAHHKLKQSADAVTAYKQGVKLNSHEYNEILLCSLAGAYLALRQFNDSITACEYATRGAPNDPKPWEMLGRSYVCVKNYGRAADAFTNWTKLEPQDAEAWRWLAVAYLLCGDFQDTLRGQEALARSKALRQAQSANSPGPHQASPIPAKLPPNGRR